MTKKLWVTLMFASLISITVPWAEAQDATRTQAEEIDRLRKQAVSLQRAGNTTAAIAALKSAVDKGATQVDIFLDLSTLLRNSGDSADAIAVLQQGTRRIEGSGTGAAKLYNNLGNVYRAQGQCGQAIRNFERALSLDPDLAGPNLNIGHCLTVQKQYEQANPFYLNEIRLAPDAATTYEAYLNLGIYFQEVAKDYDKGIQFLQNGVRVGAGRADRYKAYNALGNCYYLKGDTRSAIRNWRRVVELAPGSNLAGIARGNIAALKR